MGMKLKERRSNMINNNYFSKKNNALKTISICVTLCTISTSIYIISHKITTNYTTHINHNKTSNPTTTINQTVKKTSKTTKLENYFVNIKKPEKTYNTIQLENGYKVIFNQWGIYIIKNKKNIKGEGIPFIEPSKKLTIKKIQKLLQTPHLWPPGHSLTAATTQNNRLKNKK